MTLQLTRKPADGTSVRGVLSLAASPYGSSCSDPRSPSSNGIPSLRSGIPTLENLDYLIPAGTYRIAVTWSPRFKRPLPLVCDVVGAPDDPNRPRSGIRFHRGSVPEHSRGCILLRTTAEVDALTALLQGHPNTLIIK